MDAHTLHDQQRLVIARQRFVEGVALPSNLLPSTIAHSWARSREAGLLPWQSWLAEQDDSLLPLDESDQQLAECVRPEIDRLWQQIGGASWTIFCVNTRGVIVHARQARTLDGPLLPLQIGRRIQESDIGTTAPSCTLAEGVPMVLIGNQHYLSDFEHFFCVSVPIRGLHGEVIGVLDITGIGDRQAGAVLEQLSHAAMAAENRFFTTLGDCRILSLQHDPRLLGTPLQGLLAVDQTGRIQNANRAAQRLLGLEQFRPIGKRLDQLFEESSAIDLHRAQQQLTLSDGSRLYAQVIEQRRESTALHVCSPLLCVSILGADPQLNRQLDNARKAFAAGVPILLQGETGTGKEVFARALHDQWNAQAPFVAINCSAIPESLIEAELFGYVEGTFTGARKGGASGQLEAAHGGTLLLDEIGDMPAALQTRLLRVLQEREITRLGSTTRRALDVRVISATHCDLQQRMLDKSFREDLYYRLNGLKIRLPALRERQDLNTLIDLLRQRYGAPPLEHQALMALHRQVWPGNIRQLEQTLRLAAALASDQPMILLEHLPADMRAESEQERGSDLQDAVRRTVESALQANAGNISATASQLGISRTTLYKKLGRITKSE
ncbi:MULTISPECIES: sigma-54-dependent Fis family transcriptional regulator [Pseudomonadota]|jgi:transcriptional regulator of acetoin/glycerol metabolism|uniref:sigma-54-dependent Fis family transcriptional regulator n=1 Tax=Pseudomonadota TaxID=1224 RepID=UPI00032B2EEE|nr:MULTISPECIES: sigma-54-dependent Fis family transcriptional regulator [Pseudomonadota]ELV1376259.1 sigma-54-dependent Fis family transcriptional regulator [Pseudomonas aeruginosa]TXI00870.1 MAG: sigma-54-dependent Fis family transcriptional regulator [Pseudomonas monteilii]AGL46508.1 Fis family GAF modulated sigma54 specific transcriptional regulator [Pseudomonas aeruginosa PA96]ELF6208078.1 sigma-54-dependent Fis family transcriptional regulator [Pseudomonas putida]ELU0818307.1 sigma-54-de